MIDGIIMRTAEDEYYSNWLEPYIGYALQKGNYDAVGENITGQVFLFQVAGPRSLEILEKASGGWFRSNGIPRILWIFTVPSSVMDHHMRQSMSDRTTSTI